MKLLLKRMLDENEFLFNFGIRAVSRAHLEQPYTFHNQPRESNSGLFGGNSNWRGPVWFPVNFLIVESLQKFHHYYGDDFRIECPTGSGRYLSIDDIAGELSRRLTGLFLKNEAGVRPVFGHCGRYQSDPRFENYLHSYEYFHGDTGRGVGASHQTGWTGLIAKLVHPRAITTASTEEKEELTGELV